MDIRIYVAAHKRFQLPVKDIIYIPLQVGREGKEDLGYLPDNTGDQISVKNENYCELTGLYWIWKNISCDVAGLCHYRRYLMQDKKQIVKGASYQGKEILSKDYIEKVMEEYDMILPDSSMSQYQNEYEHYKDHHQIKDLECCLQVIREQCPKYEDAFLWTLSSNLISMGNIMIAKKDLFDKYCEWLFSILFEVEKRSDLSNYDQYQKRIYGFLSERLLRTWVMMQDIKVREEAVYMDSK